MFKILAVYIFTILCIVYYFFQFGTIEQTELILTIATFLFATFTGFFLSRQSSRHASIREQIADYDGHMSALYRNISHMGKRPQAGMAKILKKHYTPILEEKDWNYHFLEKTTTMTDIHALLDGLDGIKKKPTTVQAHALEYAINSLQQLQIIRKEMVNLQVERIPKYQWVLILTLGLILLLTVSTVPTIGAIIPTVLKAAFGTSIMIVLIILWELDQLTFFEAQIGRSSAQDIIDIIEGKK